MCHSKGAHASTASWILQDSERRQAGNSPAYGVKCPRSLEVIPEEDRRACSGGSASSSLAGGPCLALMYLRGTSSTGLDESQAQGALGHTLPPCVSLAGLKASS